MRAPRGDRPRLELLQAGRVHRHRGVVAAQRRDLPGGEDRRRDGGHRQAGGGADAARAGDAGRVRPLLRGGGALDGACARAGRDEKKRQQSGWGRKKKTIARGGPARWTPWPPARSATPRMRPAFLAEARKRTQLPIRVLSREQEARYGYLAAVNSTTLSDGCMLDLGGGSMQLVGVRDRRAHESGSWRVGAVRMTERFLPNGGPAKPRQIEALREHVARSSRARRGCQRPAGAWWGSAVRCAASPPWRSARKGCRATACRA